MLVWGRGDAHPQWLCLQAAAPWVTHLGTCGCAEGPQLGVGALEGGLGLDTGICALPRGTEQPRL